MKGLGSAGAADPFQLWHGFAKMANEFFSWSPVNLSRSRVSHQVDEDREANSHCQRDRKCDHESYSTPTDRGWRHFQQNDFGALGTLGNVFFDSRTRLPFFLDPFRTRHPFEVRPTPRAKQFHARHGQDSSSGWDRVGFLEKVRDRRIRGGTGSIGYESKTLACIPGCVTSTLLLDCKRR